MTDAALPAGGIARPATSILTRDEGMRRRNAAEARFRAYGIIAIAISLATLALMLVTIFAGGVSAFRQATITFPVEINAEALDPNGDRDPAAMALVTTIGYGRVLGDALVAEVAARGYQVEGLTDRDIRGMISADASARLRNQVLADPELVGQTIEMSMLASGRIDGFFKGRVTMETAERDGRVTVQQLQLAELMAADGMIAPRFNWRFFTGPDASDQRPEAAGLGVALIGSAYMMILVLVMALPIGVAASIYLEEFAPRNRWTDLIEVNIANLAAVPSIVYGILALAIFINFMELPISSSVVGALALTLMTLPTIIIATRASLKAVPPSIRDAALGVGASKMQVVFHHVLPLAAPGILTGTILGLATALGETAPLLLIGMVAFVQNHPSAPLGGFLEPATALPVQVFGWSQRADPAFVEKSAGAIIVLLAFLLVMNAIAIYLRRRFERRW